MILFLKIIVGLFLLGYFAYQALKAAWQLAELEGTPRIITPMGDRRDRYSLPR